jgi:hypothetical protein
MTRFLFALLILGASPVMAKDDGGFGAARFSSQAPAALGESSQLNQLTSTQETILKQNPADIEPAGGDESEVQSLEIDKSNHKTEPYIIKKDLEIR